MTATANKGRPATQTALKRNLATVIPLLQCLPGCEFHVRRLSSLPLLTGASQTHSRCRWQEQLEDRSWCHESKCSTYGKCSVIIVISACRQKRADLEDNSQTGSATQISTFIRLGKKKKKKKSHKSSCFSPTNGCKLINLYVYMHISECPFRFSTLDNLKA